jgi:hypothetical protein
MLTEDQMVAGMGAAVDQIKHMVLDHEETEHAGLECPVTRANAVAFLAHQLRIPSRFDAWWDQIRQHAAQYESKCGCQGNCEE